MSEFNLIYLVGFMGSGKTTVGRRLAELLGWAFVDLDHEVEKLEGMSIAEIFSLRGEEYFRSLECRELRRVSLGGRSVVAVGGGAFCSPENVDVIHRTGFSVWLDAPVDLLFERCSSCPETRPLFAGLEEMSALLQRRIPAYARASLRVQVGGLEIDQLAQQVLDQVRRRSVSK